MKRNLALTAVALVCSAGAQAQSSVTMWGVVDVNVQRFDAGGVGSVTSLGNGSLSTGQLGFRGVEDLGGGLRAGFWLEGSINADSGTGRTSNTNNQTTGGATAPPNGAQGFVFDRRSYVSLGGTWGELRLGHDYVPTHYNSVYFDPFNANGAARFGTFTFSGVTPGPLPTTITASNSVSYWTPANLGGFYGVAMYALGENASNVANARDGTLKSVRIGYARGSFDVAAAYSHTDYVSTAAIGNYTHANIGASWNAGFAKFFALYNQIKVDVLNGPVRKNSWEIGAHVPVSAVGKIRASYARLDERSAVGLVNGNGTPRFNNDASQWGIGYVHDLSKRTALYGTYARISNRGQAAYAVFGGPAPAPGRTSSGLEIGVRHAF
jgi:predicted porin